MTPEVTSQDVTQGYIDTEITIAGTGESSGLFQKLAIAG